MFLSASVRNIFLLFYFTAVLCWKVVASDPLEELKSFTEFPEIELQRLINGEIFVERGPVVDFPRGISGQACFLVMTTPEKTAAFYRTRDASSHESLKLYFHLPIHSPPMSKDFEALDLNSRDSFEWFIKKTPEITSENSAFQLNRSEALLFSEYMKNNQESKESINHCWKESLKTRASTFQTKGLAGLLPYEMKDDIIAPVSELRSMFNEIPKVSARFHSFLSETIFREGMPNQAMQPYYYWELAQINDQPALDLGAIFVKSGNSCQLLDVVYYSSNGIYVSCILCQIWPIQIDGKKASLVWHAELVSTPSMANAKGVERMGGRALMLQNIKRSVQAFQEDIAKTISPSGM